MHVPGGTLAAVVGVCSWYIPGAVVLHGFQLHAL